MSDDPFAHRPEDFLNRGLKVTVGSLPILGGALGDFLSFVVGGPAQERRDDFMKDTLRRLIDLEQRFESLKPETLRMNEAFQATFIQAAQASLRTAQAKKREMLGNAILNSAIGTIDENVRQMFVQHIDRLTAMHVAILKLLNDPTGNPLARARAEKLMAGGLTEIVRSAIPELTGKDALANALVNDLEAMGLVTGAALNVTMSGSGLLQQRTTDLGRAFLRFISDPATGDVP
jgi:hypothetical protein